MGENLEYGEKLNIMCIQELNEENLNNVKINDSILNTDKKKLIGLYNNSIYGEYYHQLLDLNRDRINYEKKIRDLKNKEYTKEYITLINNYHKVNFNVYNLITIINRSLNTNNNIASPPSSPKQIIFELFIVNQSNRPDNLFEMHKIFYNYSKWLEIIYTPTIMHNLDNSTVHNIRHLKQNDISTTMTHIHLWKKCVEDNMSYIIISNDNIKTTENFENIKNVIKNFIMDDIDILFFRDDKDYIFDIDTFGKDYIIESELSDYINMDNNINNNLYLPIKPHIYCDIYIISNQGCIKCLSNCRYLSAPYYIQLWYGNKLSAYITNDIYINSVNRKNYELDFIINNFNYKKITGIKNPLSVHEKKNFRGIIKNVNRQINQIRELYFIIRKYKDWYLPYYYLAISYRNQKNLYKAYQYFVYTLERNNTVTNINIEFAIFLDTYYYNYPDLTITQYLICLELDKYVIQAYCSITRILVNNNYDNKEIIKWCERGIEIDNNNVELLNRLAYLYKILGNTNQSLKYYIKSLENKPNNYVILYNIGDLIYKSEKISSNCVSYLLKCIKISPKYTPAYITLCQYYRDNKYYSESLNLLNKTLKRFPDVNIYLERSITNYELGKLKDSRNDLNIILKKINITQCDKHLLGEVYLLLALLFQSDSNMDKAKYYFNIIVENIHNYFNNDKRIEKVLIKYGKFLLLNNEYFKGSKLYYKFFDNISLGLDNIPDWDGIPGKEILAYHFDNVENFLLLFRLVPLISNNVKKMYVLIPDNIFYLFSDIYVDNVILRKISKYINCKLEVDFKCNLFQLIYILNIKYVDIKNYNFIKTTDNMCIRYSNMLDLLFHTHKYTILLKWKNGSNSINLYYFEKLFKIPNINWVIFEKDIMASDNKILTQYKIKNLYNQDLQPYSNILILISKIDLTITVDGIIPHIAGNINCNTILLLTVNPNWYWGINSSETKWYPSLTLIRQSNSGEWPLNYIYNIICDKISM